MEKNIIDMMNKLLDELGEHFYVSDKFIYSCSEEYDRWIKYPYELRRYNDSKRYVIYTSFGEILFDNTNNIYIDGLWAYVLNDYVKQIPAMKKEIREKKKRDNKCKEICGKLTYLYINNDKIYHDAVKYTTKSVILNSNLRLVYEEGKGPFNKEQTRLMLFNDNNGLLYSYRTYYNVDTNLTYYIADSFEEYIPGSWENEIDELIKLKKKDSENKDLSIVDKIKKI